MTDELRKQILDELREYSGRPGLEPDEITVSDYAEEFGCNHQLAAQRLRQLVVDGRMTMRKGIHDHRSGKVVNAYRMVEIAVKCA